MSKKLELSVVIPCLNEADTLEICIAKINQILNEHKIEGEIIVADNGSTDGSPQIANRLQARLVTIEEKGYGNALMGGIAAAKGKFIIMGDADDSYDFLEIPKFLEKLRQGYDLVQGCRMPSGGGTIKTGAMPFLHRWWGNPMFSYLVRAWFKAPINDVYCGLRGFTKVHYESLNQRCVGMEFAIEMIIKSSLYAKSRGTKIAEVPITLHPDGRKSHAPHLRTFRDGWRTLRFFLMCSPRWLFLIPGFLLIFLGLLGSVIGLTGAKLGNITFGLHTVLFGSLAILCGYQAILFSLFAKTFAIGEGLLPEDEALNKFFELVNLERGLVMAAVVSVIGFILLLIAVIHWWSVNFGELHYPLTMSYVIPGATLVAIGFQTILSGFFLSILGLKRK